MKSKHPLFEVWFSQGSGLRRGPGFRLLHDAEHYVHEHAGEGRFAVRAPDGHWETFSRRPRDHVRPR